MFDFQRVCRFPERLAQSITLMTLKAGQSHDSLDLCRLLECEDVSSPSRTKKNDMQPTARVLVSEFVLGQHDGLVRGDTGDDSRVHTGFWSRDLLRGEYWGNEYAGSEAHDSMTRDRMLRFDHCIEE